MPKPKRTRGRIALAGVGLRDLFIPLRVPVGVQGFDLTDSGGHLCEMGRGVKNCRLAVDFAAMPNLDDQDSEGVILEFAQDPIVLDSIAPEASKISGEGLAKGSRIVGRPMRKSM